MSSYYYSNDGRGRGGFLSSLPPVTKNLLIINVIFYIATLLNKNFMIQTFALFYPSSPFFRWWQVLTHMFMHGNFMHIFFNMYTLLMFGCVIERTLGAKKFVLYYFVCGFGAAALHTGVEYLQMQSFMDSAALGHSGALSQIIALRYTPTVGASGAIYGLLISYAFLFPKSQMTLLFPPVTMSAKWMITIFIVLEFLAGMSGKASDVAHFAHLGGALIGLLVMWIWKRRHILFDKDKI